MFDPNQYVPLDALDPQLRFVFVILLVWSVTWKLISLWKSARHGQKIWFVALMLVNSVGILDMIYLGFFQKGEENIITKIQKKYAFRKLPKKSKNKR
jgi:hypothetical protein